MSKSKNIRFNEKICSDFVDRASLSKTGTVKSVKSVRIYVFRPGEIVAGPWGPCVNGEGLGIE